MWILPLLVVGTTIVLAIPLGLCMARIFDGRFHGPSWLRWVEARMDTGPQSWKQYAVALLYFNVAIFIVGFAGLVVALGSTVLVLRQGAFLMRLSLVTLVVSIALSWISAHAFGLAGAAAGSVTAIYVDYVVLLRRIAACIGIPIRRLQDWRTLGLLILFAVLAAALAWSMVDRYFAGSGPLVRLIIGGTLFAGPYAAMAALAGMGRGWLAVFNNPEQGL